MLNATSLNTSHQTVSWFKDQDENDHLVLDPPFQRRPVWTNEEKSFLVDTILRSYPVPEIYVFSRSSDDGTDVFAVVDGQQRVRACLEFMADGFAVSFDHHKLEPLYTLADTPWYNKKFSQLEPELKARFRRYKMIVRELENVSDDQLRHMFHRLNQSNFALNAQELRFSMYEGGLLSLVEELVEREEWGQFALFTKNQHRRMLDSEFIAELVIGHLHWPQNKKDNLDHYYRQYGKDFPFGDEVNERFDFVIRYLAEIFPKARMNRTRWYRKSDFYTLFLAISRGKIDVTAWSIDELRRELVSFASQVSSEEVEGEHWSVGEYRRSVVRAATDRSRRVRREEALIAFLEQSDFFAAPELDLESDVDDEAGVSVEYDEEYEDR